MDYEAIIDALRRGKAGFFGGGGSMPGGGLAGGGRVSYDLPLSDDQRVQFGVVGGGPLNNKLRDLQVNGADVRYQTGPHSFGVEYDRGSPAAARALRLKYSREF